MTSAQDREYIQCFQCISIASLFSESQQLSQIFVVRPVIQNNVILKFNLKIFNCFFLFPFLGMKLKRVSYDTWSTREQLCLASSVLKSGDQNWIGVSRSLKPFAEKEALRPSDWFSQKSCAMQYAILLENADAPKRKKRETGETTGESIVRRLTQERIAELGQILAFQRDEYQQLKGEVNLLRSGTITEEKLQKMWLAIEQEEREQEQKARAHSAWLAKRQQKQDVQTLQTVTLASPRKTLEVANDSQDTANQTNEDEERKNRGGRSPLLTSLLKSPSPTMQIQTPASSAQVTSPTIASLLCSSPKVPNPQVSQSLPPQLHQFAVSTAMTNTVQERPSVGAPTLSMLLELPANLQRGALTNLQTAASTAPQQIGATDILAQSHQTKQTLSQNETTPIARQPTIATPNIPVDESMVQIIDHIDHIDDVIRKDIMADVIDKDEINEIIGDIEELIKEDIAVSPPTIAVAVPTMTSTPVQTPALEITKVIVPERPEPRDVDEPVSLSNSPESEMAIEEIDQSTSSIAEIIGTVAIEPVEPKITVIPVPEVIPQIEAKEKEFKTQNPETEKFDTTESATISEEKQTIEKSDTTVQKEEEKVSEEPETGIEEIMKPERKSKTPEPKSSPKSPKDKEYTAADSVVIVTETENSDEHSVANKESPIEAKEKDERILDQIEMNLAKITGDQNEGSSAEVASVCSEVTTDATSIEDTEKSQDISTILEDDDSSRNSTNKKKDADEQSTSENAIDGSDSQESFKDETISKDTGKESTDKSSTSLEMSVLKTEAEQDDDESKANDSKDSDDSLSLILPEIENCDAKPVAKLEREKTPMKTEKCESDEKEPTKSPKCKVDEIEVKKCEMPILKEETPDIKVESESESLMEQILEPKKEEKEVKEENDDETRTISMESELSIKKEHAESAGSIGDDICDFDEEESSLSKLSGGRAMKTYSKKQIIAVDSEPENENNGETVDYRAWKKSVMLVYNRLAAHKFASVFLRPITEDQAPGYQSVIFRPMDLSTIKKNIENGTIRTTTHFQRDVMLMFQNAIMYNSHDTSWYKMAVSMQEDCLQHMQVIIQ